MNRSQSLRKTRCVPPSRRLAVHPLLLTACRRAWPSLLALSQLCKFATLQHLPAGTVVITQGDKGTSVFLPLIGHVDLYHQENDWEISPSDVDARISEEGEDAPPGVKGHYQGSLKLGGVVRPRHDARSLRLPPRAWWPGGCPRPVCAERG